MDYIIRARWQNARQIRCQLYLLKGRSEQQCGVLFFSPENFKQFEHELSAGAKLNSGRVTLMGKYYTDARPDFEGGTERRKRGDPESAAYSERRRKCEANKQQRERGLEKVVKLYNGYLAPAQPFIALDDSAYASPERVSRRTSKFDPVAMALEMEARELALRQEEDDAA